MSVKYIRSSSEH